jgi:tRNA wybutosine-synthesizing protein 3
MNFEVDVDRWRRIRNYHLEKLRVAKEEKKVDEGIIPLVETINKVEDFVTRSSCYGRILLLREKGIPKKGRDVIIGKYHRPITLDELIQSFSRVRSGILWMNIESTIVHVAARSLERALELYEIAYKAGYRNTSLISLSKRGVTIEVLEREKVSVPIYIFKHNFTYQSGILNRLLKYVELMFYDINTKMKKFIHDYSVYFKL